MKHRPYTPLVPLDAPHVERDSQGLIDAVKREFFPDEVGPWYTVRLHGSCDTAGKTDSAPHTDSSTAFTCLSALFAPAR